MILADSLSSVISKRKFGNAICAGIGLSEVMNCVNLLTTLQIHSIVKDAGTH